MPAPSNGPTGPDQSPEGSGGSGQQSDQQQPSAQLQALRERVRETLAEQGYRPEIDNDGDVAVKVEGQVLFVRAFDTQPPLIRVFGQWAMDENVPGDAFTRMRAANALTGALNLVKVTALDEWLVVAVDLVVTEGTPLDSLLPGTLDAVRGSVQTWHSTVMRLLQED